MPATDALTTPPFASTARLDRGRVRTADEHVDAVSTVGRRAAGRSVVAGGILQPRVVPEAAGQSPMVAADRRLRTGTAAPARAAVKTPAKRTRRQHTHPSRWARDVRIRLRGARPQEQPRLVGGCATAPIAARLPGGRSVGLCSVPKLSQGLGFWGLADQTTPVTLRAMRSNHRARRTARPSSMSEAAARCRSLGIVRPAGGGRQLGRSHRTLGQAGQQAPAALTERALERRLRRADPGGTADRIRCRTPGLPPRALARDRAPVDRPARASCRRSHRDRTPPVPTPTRARGEPQHPRAPAPLRDDTDRPARARATKRPAFVSTSPMSRSYANTSTARAVYGPMPGSASNDVQIVRQAAVVLRAHRDARTHGGSRRGGCSRVRTTP